MEPWSSSVVLGWRVCWGGGCVGVASAELGYLRAHISYQSSESWPHKRFRRILAYVASTAFLQFCFVGARLRKHTDGRPKQIGYSSEGCPILQHNDQGKMSTIEGWSGKASSMKNNKHHAEKWSCTKRKTAAPHLELCMFEEH